VSGDALVAIGFYLIFLVYRENTFTSTTIEVAEHQTVISTGPPKRKFATDRLRTGQSN